MTPLIKLRRPNNSLSGIEPSLFLKLFASGLFTGYVPVASGTVGSLFAVGFYFIPGFENPLVFTVIILTTFLIGIKTAGIMEQRYGHDPAEVTIDEVVGMWISLFLLPKKILVALAAFFIFRFFDIIKPFPARKFDTDARRFWYYDGRCDCRDLCQYRSSAFIIDSCNQRNILEIEIMKAEIISIGDELLIGQVINSNQAYHR